jgi:hypothetical protein
MGATYGSLPVVGRLDKLYHETGNIREECRPEGSSQSITFKFLHYTTMNKHHQPKVHPSNRSSRPPDLSPIDVLIDGAQGSSVALEATPARIKASKRMLHLTPFQKNTQLARDNAALRAELARLHRMESAYAYFTKDVKEGVEILQQAIFELRKAQKDIDNEGTETEKIEIGIDRYK